MAQAGPVLSRRLRQARCLHQQYSMPYLRIIHFPMLGAECSAGVPVWPQAHEPAER